MPVLRPTIDDNRRSNCIALVATFGVALPYFTAAIMPLTWEFSNGLENTEDR
jgi:hypothetical protein